jgi:hypothetical protein
MSVVLLMGVASLSRRPRSCACKRCAQPRTLAKTARRVRKTKERPPRSRRGTGAPAVSRSPRKRCAQPRTASMVSSAPPKATAAVVSISLHNDTPRAYDASGAAGKTKSLFGNASSHGFLGLL